MMRVLFAGGGTGGHIYPAVAIAKAIVAVRPDAEILFIGAVRGMETRLVPKEGFRLETVQVSGLSRSNPLQALNSLWQAGHSLSKVRRIIREFQPDVAVGTGGYVSGPALFAAARNRIPTLIHEQNAFPGLTTRILSRFATVVAVSHEEAKPRLARAKRIVVTGLPIRRDFYQADGTIARQKLGIDSAARVVLTVGGSGGALRLNQVVALAAAELMQDPDCLLMQVTGERYFDEISRQKELCSLPQEAKARWQVIRFMYDMPLALAAADLVVSRAGASTMEEIAAVGVPAIFIPSPNVTDNHQEHNANALASKGAAVVIKDELLDQATLCRAVQDILRDDGRRVAMAKASKAASHPEASESLVRLVLQLSKN